MWLVVLVTVGSWQWLPLITPDPLLLVRLLRVAQAAMDYAYQYAQERMTMGKPIYKHQAVSFMIADMAINIDAGRLRVGRHQI